MTDEEIKRDWELSKDKRKQITVLAQLNDCTTEEIRAALVRQGVDARRLPRRKRKKTEEPLPIVIPEAEVLCKECVYGIKEGIKEDETLYCLKHSFPCGENESCKEGMRSPTMPKNDTEQEMYPAESYVPMKAEDGDTVRVVRCKDCIYCRDQGEQGLWCDHPDERNPNGCKPDDYCNAGLTSDDDPSFTVMPTKEGKARKAAEIVAKQLEELEESRAEIEKDIDALKKDLAEINAEKRMLLQIVGLDENFV